MKNKFNERTRKRARASAMALAPALVGWPDRDHVDALWSAVARCLSPRRPSVRTVTMLSFAASSGHLLATIFSSKKG